MKNLCKFGRHMKLLMAECLLNMNASTHALELAKPLCGLGRLKYSCRLHAHICRYVCALNIKMCMEAANFLIYVLIAYTTIEFKLYVTRVLVQNGNYIE